MPRGIRISTRVTCLAVHALLSSGCYLSHERDVAAGDAGPAPIDAPAAPDAPAPRDAGPTCRFSVARGGERTTCDVPVASTESCAQAALCLCGASDGSVTPTELLACASPDLTPRGDVTFTDFCSEIPPARTSFSEAIRGYLSFRGATVLVETSPACDDLPALIGTRPFADCGSIAARLCACVPGCDLDAALGRECLALPPERAGCVRRRVEAVMGCSFVPTLPALAARCE